MPAVKILEDMMRKFVLEELLAKGWTHTQEGVPVHDLSYDELKSELVLMDFREIDTECEANAYF